MAINTPEWRGDGSSSLIFTTGFERWFSPVCGKFMRRHCRHRHRHSYRRWQSGTAAASIFLLILLVTNPVLAGREKSDVVPPLFES